MAFNTLEYLRDGKVDFVYHQTPYDREHLIGSIRHAPNRVEIINGFLDKLKDDLPSYCFHIIYDIKEFAKEAYELLDVTILSPSMLKDIFYNSTYGKELLKDHLDYFLTKENDDLYLEIIAEYAIKTNDQELLHRLSRHRNLHIRYLFMCYLITDHPELLKIIYDDIAKYTTEYTYEEYEQLTLIPELMNPEDISSLAVKLLEADQQEEYDKLKQYIVKEYKQNYLASKLLRSDPFRKSHHVAEKQAAFKKDAEILFKTSKDYRYEIYRYHSNLISKQLIEEFAEKIKYFARDEINFDLNGVYLVGLGDLLEKWIQKYLALSKRKDYEYLGSGTTCACYRIGDYAFKLVKTKWSYEDVICPNLYLIAKNYEEIYIRDRNGVVRGGIEVQKYLSRTTDGIDMKYFGYFDNALEKLGYRRTDTLTHGVCGENTMLLDTFMDADCPDPRRLPVWFKQYPIVLIDRDRIYPKDKTYIKQLTNSNY